MSMFAGRFSSHRFGAFTLVEVLVVVVIIAIISMVVVPSISNAGSLTVQAASRRLISDLEYAKNEAIGKFSMHKLIFDVPNNSYQFTDSNDQVLSVPWVSGPYVVDFDQGKQFEYVKLHSVDFGGDNWVGFDELGAPTSGGTVELSANDIRYRVVVASVTGRVSVEPVTED